MTRGRFITLEGGEGAGKSAQARRLADRLGALGVETVLTREPGGTPYAERLREIILSGTLRPLGPECEATMFAAARLHHLDALIAPALARGAWVVCDRFADSTRAYQGAAQRLSPEFIATLEGATVGDRRPQLTLVLDIAPEIGLARAAARRTGDERPDRFESEGVEFHRALRAAFLSIARAEPERCALIDAARDEADVAEAIWGQVVARLGPHLPIPTP